MMHKAWSSIERCPIVFQGHPSNFKVTQYKTSPILTQIGRFRTIGRSQLSNPSDLPCWLCSHHSNVMKFSGVITNDQSKVHAKDQGQRSKVKVTTQLNHFRTVTPVWIHIWWWNDAYSFTLLRRGAKERCPIVFEGHPSNFKVTRYKTSLILTQIGRFRTIGRLQFSNPSDLPCWRSSVKFQGHGALKIVQFEPN